MRDHSGVDKYSSVSRNLYSFFALWRGHDIISVNRKSRRKPNVRNLTSFHEEILTEYTLLAEKNNTDLTLFDVEGNMANNERF